MTGISLRVHLGFARIALCTIAALAVLGAADPARGADATTHDDRYRIEQVSRGARKIPVLARLEYESARDLAAKGEKDQAEDRLRRAVRLDPDYSNAYFALARLELGRFHPSGLVDLIEGIHAATRTYRGQSHLAVNGASLLSYMLLVINLVVCFAFSIKYLPYVAHKLGERLTRRHNAVFPRVVSYLILLSPVALFADTIIPLAYLTGLCWLSMYRREKAVVIALVAPFVLAGLFDIHVRLAAVVADPKSFTSLINRANSSAAEENLFRSLEQASPSGMEAEKNLALGLLRFKDRRYHDASDYLFQSFSFDPPRAMGYINLGNIHFMQGDYEKALQGYRKAESIDPVDPICQYNLAQAYIKTLLMKEASRSLQLAASGIEEERATYTADAFESTPVLLKLFSEKELWQMALAEAKSLENDRAAEGRALFPWLPRRGGALIVLIALTLVILLGRFVDPAKLTFQCSNCGKLTCNNCCNAERNGSLCQECAKSIVSVTSEKVVEALLRQRRQSALIRRRKAKRIESMVLPGVRDIYHGHVSRGVALALFFSVSVVCLLTGGTVFHDPTSLDTGIPLWQMLTGVMGIVVAYVMSARSKSTASFKPQRHRSGARRATGPVVEPANTSHAA